MECKVKLNDEMNVRGRGMTRRWISNEGERQGDERKGKVSGQEKKKKVQGR